MEESDEEGDSSTDPNKEGSKGKGPKKDGRWTDEEHAKFIEGLFMYGKNWNKVHKHVVTRSSAQTRSHA
jgi:SHAQKYF class myb-like DNA-binding protein